MKANSMGVTEPIITLNPQPTNHADLFNIDEDRSDEIAMAMKRAVRKVANAENKKKPYTRSSDVVAAVVGIAKTPEELAFVMLLTGMHLKDMSNTQDQVLGSISNLLNHLGGRQQKGNFSDDLMNSIKDHLRNEDN